MKIGSWRKVRKNSSNTLWRNSTSNEEIRVEKDKYKRGWRSSVATGIKSLVFLTREDAEADAVAYMRDFPYGEKTYYKNVG